MLEEENPAVLMIQIKHLRFIYEIGLYITEIVKRLFQSKNMKELFPSKDERLQHIFEKQVFGLAPTVIIYKIALNYILGFDDTIKIEKHNFKQVDALPFSKNATLKEELDKIFD